MTSVTVSGREVTREAVLGAIAEHDRLGAIRFLRRYGYRQASRFHLRHDGRSYPSKAILGVAAGLSPADFFGGASGAAASLARLGFQVRNSETGALMSRQLDSLRRACEREGLDVGERPWPDTDVVPAAYFASGTNRATEIRGMTRAGADIGVTATELRESAEAELHALAGSDVQVFVDSGAFSGKPIDWTSTLGLYRRLSATLGHQAWLTAPDVVGDQDATLRLLRRFAGDLRELASDGARILVPCQKGRLTQAEFAAEVDEILGFEWFPALPCKKAATSPEEAAAFAQARRPRHTHLLGLGIRSRKLAAYLAPFAGSSVSLDSCWLRQNVGWTNGPKGGPKRLTRARVTAKRVLARRGVDTVGAAELATYCCLAKGLVR